MAQIGDNGNSKSLIQVRRLAKSYRRGNEELHVLQGIDLDIDQGDFVAFMGPSGSGKSTLLNLVGGLDVPSSGTVTVGGEEISSLSRARLTDWRARHVGFVFQLYNLLPVLSARRNVELPLLLTPLSRTRRREHVDTALSLVGLAFAFEVSPSLLGLGLAFALLMGLAGGVPPAIRAARLPLTAALRDL